MDVNHPPNSDNPTSLTIPGNKSVQRVSQEVPAEGWTKFLATAEEAYGAGIATLRTQLLEADRCKAAAQEHLRNVHEQRMRSCVQSHTIRLLAADSEQAEEIKSARREYYKVGLAASIERAKALQAWKTAQSLVGERKAEQERVLSRQDELVRHLTALFSVDEAAQRVANLVPQTRKVAPQLGALPQIAENQGNRDSMATFVEEDSDESNESDESDESEESNQTEESEEEFEAESQEAVSDLDN